MNLSQFSFAFLLALFSLLLYFLRSLLYKCRCFLVSCRSFIVFHIFFIISPSPDIPKLNTEAQNEWISSFSFPSLPSFPFHFRLVFLQFHSLRLVSSFSLALSFLNKWTHFCAHCLSLLLFHIFSFLNLAPSPDLHTETQYGSTKWVNFILVYRFPSIFCFILVFSSFNTTLFQYFLRSLLPYFFSKNVVCLLNCFTFSLFFILSPSPDLNKKTKYESTKWNYFILHFLSILLSSFYFVPTFLHKWKHFSALLLPL